MKFTTISVLLLSILVVGVASRQLLDADVDTALEHQRILAELEEVHQLRERMLQQGRAFCISVGHMPGCGAQGTLLFAGSCASTPPCLHGCTTGCWCYAP